jgi:broad specificity phosphatase PhoE
MGFRRIVAAAAGVVALLAGPAASQAPAPAGGVLRVYLARHGQTDGNLERRAQGWTDTPLNETGRRQAAELADTLRGVPFDAIYSSTLVRSRATAEAVAGERPVTSLPGLRERGLGKWEDRALDDPEFKNRPRGGPPGTDDGETAAEFFERVRSAVGEIRAKHPAGTILIVGHAGANQQILRTLLGLAPQQAAAISQANDELFLIEINAEARPRVWKLFPEAKLNEL